METPSEAGMSRGCYRDFMKKNNLKRDVVYLVHVACHSTNPIHISFLKDSIIYNTTYEEYIGVRGMYYVKVLKELNLSDLEKEDIAESFPNNLKKYLNKY